MPYKQSAMRKICLFILLIVSATCSQAQVWTGASNTDWNNSSNWNPMTVPAANDIATIPGGLANYPVLLANIVVRSIDMQQGSRLDVNGFSFTVVSNYFVYFT